MVCYVKDEVKKLKAYTVEGNRPPEKLDANENPYELPEYIVNKMKENITLKTLNRYPDARASELCNKLASYVGNGADGDMIMVGDGSDELINIIISSFLNKGDSIVLPTPGFAMYNIFSSVNEGNIILFERNDDFSLDIDELLKTIKAHKPRLVILCNPNNPTGTLTDRESIVKLMDNSDCMVVVDEAYYEFSKLTVVDLVNRYENLIVLRTLSKAWGLAGLRLGYLISNKSVINELLKVKSPFNVNSITQELASLVLDFKDYMVEKRDLILRERELLISNLKILNGFKVYDTCANFVLVKVQDADRISAGLRKAGIAVRNFCNYKGLSNCIRITVGTSEENENLIKNIKLIIGE